MPNCRAIVDGRAFVIPDSPTVGRPRISSQHHLELGQLGGFDGKSILHHPKAHLGQLRVLSLAEEPTVFADHHLDSLAIAQLQQRIAGHAAFLFCATCQMFDPAERQHF